jgi:hypothetical protein
MIDPAFASWFSGFTDGEGCFAVYSNPHGGNKRNSLTFQITFKIALRDDDRFILEEIQKTLGIGRMLIHTPATAAALRVINPKQNPWCSWTVRKKSECIILRNIFRTYPLRTKKARDFEIWSQALDCSLAHKYGDSWEDMLLLEKDLRASHKYHKIQ